MIISDPQHTECSNLKSHRSKMGHVRIDKATINLQLKVSHFRDHQVSKCFSFTRIFLRSNIKMFILIHSRTSGNVNISFNHHYQTFAI